MKYLLLTTALVSLASCNFIPDFKKPNVETPSAWSEASAEDSAAIAKDWWVSFSSDELNGLMTEALANNNDLLAGLQRIEQARALLRISGSSLLPSVDATASAARDHTRNPRSSATTLGAGAGVAYELDLFGANSADVAAARENLKASQYAYEALKLVVMSDVAKTYFNVLNARERLRIADDNLKNSHEVLRIVEARYEAGASDALEVAQQKSELASAEAARATVVQSIKLAENALAVLAGRTPQTLPVKEKDLKNVYVPTIAAGQPSSLLERRPDIKASEAQMAAANADIGVARAAYFPSVTLGLDLTFGSSGFSDPVTTGLAASSALLAPIFEGGRLAGGVQLTTAVRDELVQNYRKTILTSFQEVEDALAAVKAAQLRETALNTAMQEARKSYELSRSRYDAGTIDFQTLLDAQRTLLSAEDAFATSKNERLAASVTLFTALGGGWSAG